MNKETNIPVSEIIQRILNESKEPLSTYELAKKAKISWSTANTHCYKLKDQGILDGRLEVAEVGSGRKMLWFMKK